MTSIDFGDIYSRFYAKVEGYDLLSLDEYLMSDFMCSWLHSSASKPYIRNLFSSMQIDDDIQTVSFEIDYALDSDGDLEFVSELLALGMAIEWLTFNTQSALNIRQIYGSKEEKFYSQSQHLQVLKEMISGLKKEQKRMIADRSVWHNLYTNGEISLIKQS